MHYQLKLQQLVKYARSRIYRQFLNSLAEDTNIRLNGGSYLFYFMVLCSKANYRTSYRVLENKSFTIAPGEWIITIEELLHFYRKKTTKAVIAVLDHLQEKGFITFTTLCRNHYIHFKITEWSKFNTEQQIASLDDRDQTYRMMFSLMTLSKTHKENLMNRGLSESDIYKYGYKSTPAFGFSNIADKLRNLGCQLEGVPGFYKKEERWLPRFCSNCSGIVIPVLSIDGKIQGAQIRLDRPINDRKYIWFSSSEKDGGIGAGSPTHFVGDPADTVVYITEGPLKATIAHTLSGKTFAAVAGVNQYSALEELLRRLKQNGTKTIVETYDMDKVTNPNVEKGCQRLLELGAKYAFEVKRLSWDPVYKGIDDYLYAKRMNK